MLVLYQTKLAKTGEFVLAEFLRFIFQALATPFFFSACTGWLEPREFSFIPRRWSPVSPALNDARAFASPKRASARKGGPLEDTGLYPPLTKQEWRHRLIGYATCFRSAFAM